MWTDPRPVITCADAVVLFWDDRLSAVVQIREPVGRCTTSRWNRQGLALIPYVRMDRLRGSLDPVLDSAIIDLTATLVYPKFLAGLARHLK